MTDQTIADVEASLAQFVAEDAVLLDRNVPILKREITALLASHRRMKEALEEIDQPLTAMKARADAAGRHLSGLAYSIAYSASHLQAIARQALQGDAHADR
ncbi:hypothetical protein [Phenylobacterium sp. 58.2.17]|uniref:hypothetical protein n=1 Tax=Phenylobacterium sp. 58.2.17 TaxID=2969306 RepID=UPI0022653CD4|nr:hypothetical protein [Phenylobacterium sp. 58.2.17]MCX7585067.1 hypothetical protein [Phenylobacterium sp. 58.2.17]